MNLSKIILLSFLLLNVFNANSKQTPNVILIVADDLGYGDLACYGQEKILTPNIDHLAAEGMKFMNAYAGSSVCAPSRSSLLTGFHNGHNRVRDNLPHGVYLKPDDFTMGELFKQGGYHTACIGKWGLGVPGSWGQPNQQGFDYFYGHKNQDQAHFYYPDFLWENDELVLLQKLVIENEVGKIKGNRGGERTFYTHDLFTEKALKYIETNAEKPFFLYLPYTLPHFSDYPKDSEDHFLVPENKPYTDKNWSIHQKNYAAMVTRMDKDVGKINALIKSLEIEENTIVIFTSDNGPYLGVPEVPEFFNSNGGLRGGKRDLYEGGIKIPLIAKWKNHITPGSSNSNLVGLWDLFPTFAEIIKYPSKLSIDGISLLPKFKGNKEESHSYLYWDYGHVRPTYKKAIRKGNYKLLKTQNQSAIFELYDLTKDTQERNNIASSRKDIVASLSALMDQSVSHHPSYSISRDEKKGVEPKVNPKVPGIVVNHRPASSGEYVGAPSIEILPNGKYVVSHNFTAISGGDKGSIHKTAIFESSDKGETWNKLSELDNQRWSSIFYHEEALYLLGVNKAFGDAVIRRSDDGGRTWTFPKDEKSGVIAKGRYHCAPVPVIVHNGRVWRAMEDAVEGRDFRAFVMSAPVNSDLLNAENWLISSKIKPDSSWNNGTMETWLEGNAVVNPEGEVVNILRTRFTVNTPDKAAIIKISADGRTSTKSPDSIIDFPGGTSKKFTIKYDKVSKKYWSLVNWIQPRDRKELANVNSPGKLRNSLVLISSDNLHDWIIEDVILYHSDYKFHAFQYVDWTIENGDILAVSRTAFDDEEGGADSYHNANFITFHRIENFRALLN